MPRLVSLQVLEVARPTRVRGPRHHYSFVWPWGRRFSAGSNWWLAALGIALSRQQLFKEIDNPVHHLTAIGLVKGFVSHPLEQAKRFILGARASVELRAGDSES